MEVQVKVPQPQGDKDEPLKVRIGGWDRRKVIFKGWVTVETFSYRGSMGSFVVMQRDVVSGSMGSVGCFDLLGNKWLTVGSFVGKPDFVASAVEVVDPIGSGWPARLAQVIPREKDN